MSMTTGTRTRLLIVDDHEHARIGIRAIVEAEPSFTIVAEARDGREALRLVEELRPDLVLMDINMPEMDGLETTKRVKDIAPETKVVMVTVSDDVAHLFEAIKRGAQGYVLKNLQPSAWLDYLRAVASDETPMPKELALKILREFGGAPAAGGTDGAGRGGEAGRDAGHADAASGAAAGPQGASASASGVGRGTDAAAAGAGRRASPLTARETEVLQLVARGYSNRAVSEALYLSEHTVKNHLKHILQKLHLENRVQLTRYAYEKGWMREE